MLWQGILTLWRYKSDDASENKDIAPSISYLKLIILAEMEIVSNGATIRWLLFLLKTGRKFFLFFH
jgi:hypothetical protein